MCTIYLKQVWNLIRQERLFSAVYIVGTGLAISMVMVLSIVFYLKVASLYPESNRDRTLFVGSGMLTWANGNVNSGSLSRHTIRSCFGGLSGLEAMTLVYHNGRTDFFVQPEDGWEPFQVATTLTDAGFWKVYPYRFLEGKPFTDADLDAAIPVVVICRSLALRLFGNEEAVGKDIALNFKRYRVVGVVEDGSLAMERSFAQVWMPYTASADYLERSWDTTGVLGFFTTILLAAPGVSLDEMKAEAESNVSRFNQALASFSLSINGQPDRQWESVLRRWGNVTPDFPKELITYGCIFLIFLLVPAVSLSGMTDSRMERRLSEMGVRRAFGAPVGTLMRQVMTENLLFTLLGGVFGLAMSYLLIYLTSDWVMDVVLGSHFRSIPIEGIKVAFSSDMLMNYSVFGVALCVCLVLNLFSSLIPAWRAARRQIIDSLNVR